jgi:electron transport complex protein RnfG
LSDDNARLRDIEVDQEQLKKVFPNGEEFKPSALQGVWTALRNGKDVGRVFETLGQGYSGPITLMFGMDSSGAVTGLRILSHTETPGLGAKITTAQFRDQFRNKRPEQLILRKHDPARGQIDAVTGATISSRAVTRALSTTIESFNSEKAGGDK